MTTPKVEPYTLSERMALDRIACLSATPCDYPHDFSDEVAALERTCAAQQAALAEAVGLLRTVGEFGDDITSNEVEAIRAFLAKHQEGK